MQKIDVEESRNNANGAETGTGRVLGNENRSTRFGEITTMETVGWALCNLKPDRPCNDFIQLDVLERWQTIAVTLGSSPVGIVAIDRSFKVDWQWREGGSRGHKDRPHILGLMIPSMNAYHIQSHIPSSHHISRVSHDHNGRDPVIFRVMIPCGDFFPLINPKGQVIPQLRAFELMIDLHSPLCSFGADAEMGLEGFFKEEVGGVNVIVVVDTLGWGHVRHSVVADQHQVDDLVQVPGS